METKPAKLTKSEKDFIELKISKLEQALFEFKARMKLSPSAPNTETLVKEKELVDLINITRSYLS